jgi:hypothetical protein
MKTFVKKTDKRSRTVLAAVFAAVCAVTFLCSFIASSDVIAAGLVEVEEGEGEWDVFETDPPERTNGAESTQETEITPTPDPDATPLPTKHEERILFETSEEGGTSNTSSPGGVIMIIIVVLAILSVVSGIVEKIVKYYKNRDKEFKVD